MCFFSINIPAYNCEETILETLESIASQSFKDWEVIVLNDGSSDRTQSICEKQTVIPEDKFTLLRVENKGPWEARMRMHSVSKGRYIISIDGDDTLVGCDALERIHDFITRTQCDVLLFNATQDFAKFNKYIDYSDLPVIGDGSISVKDALAAMCESLTLNNVCFKAYRRTAMDFGNDFHNLIHAEDRLQCFMLFKGSRSCYLYDVPLYYYRLNMRSTTHSSFKRILIDNLFEVERYINRQSRDFDFDKSAHDRTIAYLVVNNISRAYSSSMTRGDRWQYYREVLSELTDGIFLTQAGYNGGLPRRWDVMCRLFLSGHFFLFDMLSILGHRLKGK